jgi:hypothetical protein
MMTWLNRDFVKAALSFEVLDASACRAALQKYLSFVDE